ncbi:tryptophan-rich sensory protein [Gramella sp. BOM4]|nr:tryptophan-rich sensory protein [Christiangramia bathymodioli]
MSGEGILKYFRKKWWSWLLLEALIVGVGPALLAFAIGFNFFWITAFFLISASVYFAVQKPWKIGLSKVSSFVDSRYSEANYSSGLLLIPDKRLTSLARLQKQKTERQLADTIKSFKPDVNFERAFVFLLVFSILAVIAFNSGASAVVKSDSLEEKNRINFTPVDSIDQSYEIPEISKQQVFVNYPSYTNLANSSFQEMNIQALKNSSLTWILEFSHPVEEVLFETKDEQHRFKLKNNEYRYSKSVRESGFYNFRFKDGSGNTYVSKVYYLEVAEDEKPEVVIKDLPLFSSFEAEEAKILNFETQITDDYGISEAYIVATVSKGSGEAVKFRELRIDFERQISGSQKSVVLDKSIDLEELRMQPGEQLYFYVEAKDHLQLVANVARSETYFAEIRDTTEAATAISGSMGVDLMPDYFRSQRQLIIDTEKLIAEKDQITEKEFNSRSNELGFDQKALRLKYGEFMGDESESGIAAQSHSEEPADETQENEDDPLAYYTHDHDSENEHNLVPAEEEEEEDPLHDYLHNHDDPEESTLFTQSLKSMLREAMNQMWDSELQLRLYEPQNSLPYQYRSLKLLQEIKNSARIYVHRIGFDPPPIQESTRLTGDLDEVQSFSETTESARSDQLKAIRESVSRLEKIIQNKSELTESDKVLFQKAAEELSSLAIEDPLKYIETLSDLKLIAEGKNLSAEKLKQVQKGLLLAIPKNETYPGTQKVYTDKLQELFLKELQDVE